MTPREVIVRVEVAMTVIEAPVPFTSCSCTTVEVEGIPVICANVTSSVLDAGMLEVANRTPGGNDARLRVDVGEYAPAKSVKNEEVEFSK